MRSFLLVYTDTYIRTDLDYLMDSSRVVLSYVLGTKQKYIE
nr:MAG TPA: hypothetical protein [Bacteriophage sp.]